MGYRDRVLINFSNPTRAITYIDKLAIKEVKTNISFWEFLSLPIKEMLTLLAYKWLEHKQIIVSSRKKEYGDIAYANINYETVEIDLEEIVKLVFEHEDALLTVLNQECKYIVMGYDLYYRIEKARRTSPMYMQFGFPWDYDAPISNGKHKVFAGLQVIIVPWFNGLVCLPEIK